MNKTLKQIVNETKYRIKLRKVFTEANIEELKIAKEELIKEIQRRCN